MALVLWTRKTKMEDTPNAKNSEASRHKMKRKGKAKVLRDNLAMPAFNGTGAEKAAIERQQRYQKNTPQHIQQVMNELVDTVKLRKIQTSKQHIRDEFQDQVMDTGISGSCDTKVFKAMEFFWMAKTLVATTLENRGHQEPKTRDRLRKLEVKFIVLCQVVFGLSFKVTHWNVEAKEGMVEVVRTSDSNGTSNNPIIIEEDACQKISNKGKGHVTPANPSPSTPSSP